MARFKTLLAFDEVESNTLKNASSGKAIGDAAKPFVNHLKAMAEKTRKIATSGETDKETLEEAREDLEKLKSTLEQLPESEARDELLDKVAEALELMHQTIDMAQ